MNSRVTNLDRLQTDDIAGLHSQYSETNDPPAPTSGCQTTTKSGGLLWTIGGALAALALRRASKARVTPDCASS